MQVTINGETKQLSDGLTISQMLGELGIEPSQVAVEKNAEIVPKSTHAEAEVNDGDVIELVRFIGGG